MKADRIGLFGGTFDPPHFGHIAALKAAVATKQFDYIEVTVAGDPYQKSSSVQLHSADVRLKMAHAAFDGIEGVRVSDREIKRNGPSYTIETVRELLNDAEHVDLLIGADLSSQLDSWHESVLLRSLVKVGVIPRPGGEEDLPLGWNAYLVPMDPVDLSSTFIREAANLNENLQDLVPDPVIPIFEGR